MPTSTQPLRGIWSYLLWQVPGWALFALLLVLLKELLGLPVWAAVVLFVLLVVKDFVMFPFFRDAFSPSGLGRERLIGERGRVVEPLMPSGYVRVSGELWKAEAREVGKEIVAGSPIVVRDARGLVLIVEEDGTTLPE
ncbi:MAG: NfeD family protein [Candidatus Methylomirabilia bacterium]